VNLSERDYMGILNKLDEARDYAFSDGEFARMRAPELINDAMDILRKARLQDDDTVCPLRTARLSRQ